MKRIVVGLVVALLLVGGAAVWWLASSLDGLVEEAIEQVGSELLGTSVSVAGVSIDLAGGAGSIRGLEIANPRGEGTAFTRTPAVSVRTIALDLDLSSIGATPLVVTQVVLAEPIVNAEVRGTKLNLDVLRRNVSRTSGTDVEAPAAADESGAPLRLRIGRFQFEKGSLRLDTGEEDEEPREVILPSFSMQGVGGAAGAEPGVLGKAILERLLAHVAAAAAREKGRGEAKEWIDEKLEDRPAAAEAAKKLLDGVLGGGAEE